MLDVMRTFAGRHGSRRLAMLALGGLLAVHPGLAAAQGAVDPNVAPRASELDRQGERGLGIEMLGRYLAVAQSDGRAWFLLARFYLMDARDWHRAGHQGTPSADVYLSLASVAVDEAIRLQVDSAPLYRAMVDIDRSLLSLEESDWTTVQRSSASALPPIAPPILELGQNLAASCPSGAVLITGSELEWVAAWYGTVADGGRGDLVPLRLDLYATDSIYRDRMSSALGVDGSAGASAALAQVADRRPICLAPAADTTGLPVAHWTTVRLARVSGSQSPPTGAIFALTSLIVDVNGGGEVWTPDVLATYAAAARHNPVLCQSLAPVAAHLPAGACAP